MRTPDGVHLAYSVIGEGPPDLVLVPPSYSHVELYWELEPMARWFRRLGSFCRLISFDKRGSGMSDPVPNRRIPSPEEWMDDISSVLDAVGSSEAALLGQESGGPVAMLFAATYPDRVSKLILSNSFARLSRAPDYLIGIPERLQEEVLTMIGEGWGRDLFGDLILGRDASSQLRTEVARIQRLALSPGVAEAAFRATFEIDVRRVLPVISVPTLVIASADDRYVRPSHGEFLAEHIAGSRHVVIPGAHAFWVDVGVERHIEETQEFLTGGRDKGGRDRVLATVLFTDLVDSTRRVSELGDKQWRELLDHHDGTVRACLARFRGQEVHTTGDGFLATFDGPGRAIRCAAEIRESLRGLGLSVRSGIHTGEVERRGDDVAGIAVHIGARVAALAKANEVLVSSAVPPLVAGSGIEFEDRGEHELKGVSGAWKVFAVSG